MKEKVKELRVKIDGLAQLTDQLKTDSYQIYNAYGDLILAKAWLGNVLGELGTKSPYPKDGIRKTVDDIEPTADTAIVTEKPNKTEHEIWYGSNNSVLVMAKLTQHEWNEKSHIEKVDWLRQEIKGIVNSKEIENHAEREQYMLTSAMWSYFEAKKHLIEARFCLGFELQRIREEN